MDIFKGYYMLFGIFTEEIEDVIAELRKTLNLPILKSELEGDDEIYWCPKKDDLIRHLSIGYASPIGYHYSEKEILYPSYLLSCNVFSKTQIEEMDNIRKIISELPYIKELNIDIVDVDYDD